jgi:TatD DNase family protein
MSNDITWIDSHAHLTMFGEDEVSEVIDRAADRGVKGVLVPATSRDDLEDAIGLAEDYPHRIVAAAGVHPHEAATLDAGLKRRIEHAMARPSVVAMGEIGLDYHYMNSPREDQLAAFEWQLDLALETGYPVILHNRESWDDLEVRIAERRGRLRGVCHSFSEGPDEARQVMALGFMVGISGMVTFKAAHNIRQMVAVLEPGRVLVETDSPFLAPTPHRGKRNEPSFVPLVGDCLAKEWKMPIQEVASLSTAGFRALFSIRDGWPDETNP